MERRLTTILAADIVGYSRLMAADEAGTLAQLKAHRRELIEPKTAEYHGRAVKLMGDGTLMEFGSVVDAVNFAVEVQQVMVERNADVPDDRQIKYRVGINIGDIIVEGDDIYGDGDGVNVASRLEQLAVPGGIWIARNVFSQAVDADNPLALPDMPSIAVLPFQNMSGEPAQEYFSDGISDDIITALSRVRWTPSRDRRIQGGDRSQPELRARILRSRLGAEWDRALRRNYVSSENLAPDRKPLEERARAVRVITAQPLRLVPHVNGVGSVYPGLGSGTGN